MELTDEVQTYVKESQIIFMAESYEMMKNDNADTAGYSHLFLITKNINLFHINEILRFTPKKQIPDHMLFNVSLSDDRQNYYAILSYE